MIEFLRYAKRMAFIVMWLFFIMLNSCQSGTNTERRDHTGQAFAEPINNGISLRIKPLTASDTDLIYFSSEGWWGFGKARESNAKELDFNGLAFQVFPSFILEISSNPACDNQRVFIKDYSLKIIAAKEIDPVDFEFRIVTPGAADPHTFIHAFVRRNNNIVWPIDFGASFAEYLDEETSEQIKIYRKRFSMLEPGEKLEFFVSQFYEPGFETEPEHEWFFDSGKNQVLFVRAQADVIVKSAEISIESKEVILLIDFLPGHTDFETIYDLKALGYMSECSVLSEQQYVKIVASGQE